MKSLSSRTRMPRMTFSAIACGGWQMFRRRKPRANRSGLFVERFEMEPLERRVVLDSGSLAPAVATLLVDSSVALPTVSAAAQAGDFTYETADGAVTITAYTGAGGSVVIPEVIDGLPVTTIGDYAFSGLTSITSLIIGNSVTGIGMGAISDCSGLASVTIGNAVTSIGLFAFSGCTSLASVFIPASVTDLGGAAFSNCSSLTAIEVDGANTVYASADGVLFNKALTVLIQCPARKSGDYAVPDGVELIAGDAFSQCTFLTSVTTGNSVTSIGPWAFNDCSSLGRVVIGSGVASIGRGAFEGCPNLTAIDVDAANAAYASADGVLFNKAFTALVRCPATKGAGFVIPGSVTRIEDYAFSGCGGLTSVIISDSVTSLGAWAFFRCANLASVSIGNGVTSIGSGTFYDCSGLATAALGNSITRIGYAAFSGCRSLTSVTIPGAVTSIADYAFSGCRSLASVTIPGAVTSIADYAFQECSSLASLTIPGSVTSIGYAAFHLCSNVTAIAVDAANTAYASVDGVLYDKALAVLIQFPIARGGSFVIPGSVTRIEGEAFCSSIGLTSVSVPSGVTAIGQSAFFGCSLLGSIYFLGSAPTLGADTFTECHATAYHLKDSAGWSSSLGGLATAVFQPVDVPAGVTSTALIAAGVARVVKQGAGTLVFDAASTRTGGTVVEAGEVIVRNAASLGTGVLDVWDGAKVSLDVYSATVSVGGLSVASGGLIDVGYGRFTVAAGGYSLPLMLDLLQSGYASNWTGATGLGSRTAASVEGGGLGSVVAGNGSFTFGFAATGDTNMDDVVDMLDVAAMLSTNTFDTLVPASWSDGNSNYDVMFDVLDSMAFVVTGLFDTGSYIPAQSPQSQSISSALSAIDAAFLALASQSGGPESVPANKPRFRSL
jgi:autotransporter-associated beta strand protein